MQRLLAAAADSLSGVAVAADLEAESAGLLGRLGAAALVDPAERADLARLLRAATRLERLFELRSANAPGLACFGAEVSTAAFGAVVADRASVSGVGPTRLAAFRACVAEAVEYVCQFETEAEIRGRATSQPEADPEPWRELLSDAQESADDGAWVEAQRLPDRMPVALPRRLCFRLTPGRRPNGLKYALGLGVAAGRDLSGAARHALLEWVERDAVALWWRAGRPAAAVPLEAAVRAGAFEVLAQYRAGRTERCTLLLDLTTDVGIPVAAALSFGSDGTGFCYGFAAGMTLEQALVPAVEELMQIELADEVVAAKRAEGGETALNSVDRIHLERSRRVAPDWPILQPRGLGGGISPAPDLSAEDQVDAIASRLGRHGHGVYLVDLTRPDLGVPVARVVVTGLQPDPADLVTRRLANERAGRAEEAIPASVVALY